MGSREGSRRLPNAVYVTFTESRQIRLVSGIPNAFDSHGLGLATASLGLTSASLKLSCFYSYKSRRTNLIHSTSQIAQAVSGLSSYLFPCPLCPSFSYILPTQPYYRFIVRQSGSVSSKLSHTMALPKRIIKETERLMAEP